MTHIAAPQIQAVRSRPVRIGRRAGYAAALVFSLAVWAVIALVVRALLA